ncbi:thymidylate kinase [Methylophilus rhizosphaerae]|uniref:Thymidylate kinase n=1 Tax=Methylophilus rhizosphaerae TaxID=492660 RepID=A0A1G8Z896_9PROT|nr:dTMP kinase [Methylophilus rhizosphaerae]SDK11302.1 thymidylate kinase [Methylophilus rhizosphaerae]
MAGLFITLEGMDGAGKSTHIPAILQLLAKTGREVVVTREPGGTPLGETLRELLLHEEMHVETESLLMFAARAEHLHQVILPALQRNAIVVSDRFTDASYAYQCGARGLPLDKMQALETWVQGSLQPDLTLLFDVPVEVSLARLAGARTPDKFEAQGVEFFARLRTQYLARAAEYPQRFRVIDSHRPLDEVKKSVEEIILSL